ncbi:MAG: CPBP family intramembrane glutamic endopeptidase [Candidatus Acidiferrales bacterium]
MSDLTAGTNDGARTEGQRAVSDSGNRLRWFELFLVLLVGFGSFFLNSLYILIHGPTAPPAYANLRWLAGITQEVAALLVLGYVLWRRKLGFKDIGLRWSLRDAGVGLVVAVVAYAAFAGGAFFVILVHYQAYGTLPTVRTAREVFGHPGMMALPFSLLNPFCEELIVRAYLMTEVIDLTGSRALAVAISVVVQFSYHLYYGWVGAIALLFPFLIFALYYARTRQALPLIVAHECMDIFALGHLWFG